VVGNSTCPAAHVDASSDRQLKQMLTRPNPITLTAADLAPGKKPPREAAPGEGIAVSAWSGFPEVPVLVAALAVQWTDSAILIRWEAGDVAPSKPGSGKAPPPDAETVQADGFQGWHMRQVWDETILSGDLPKVSCLWQQQQQQQHLLGGPGVRGVAPYSCVVIIIGCNLSLLV
jgi:hypothetical protein